MHPIGNQKHYQANPAAAIFAELRTIVLRTFDVADVLRAAMEPFWPQVEVAFVYGSLASGSEHAGSDVDLMVIGRLPSNAQLLEALLPARDQLGRALNPTLYTVDEFAQRVRDEQFFIVRVLQQPAILVKGSEHDLSRLGGEPDPDQHADSETARSG